MELLKTNHFERMLKLCKNRGCDMSAVKHVLEQLKNNNIDAIKHRPHKWQGTYKKTNLWALHIKNDLLLLYQINQNSIELIAIGTHSDLCYKKS